VQWHRLSPRNPDECRYRSQVRADSHGESATCDLVRTALPFADERLARVPREACAACCTRDPAVPATWNTVVASLVYQAASAAAADPSTSASAAALAEDVRLRAEVQLELAGGASDVDGQRVQQFTSLSELIPPRRRRKGRIARWAVGVTTAPRRSPTLERCLDHLARAGWDSPHLFIDAAVRVPARFGHLPGTLRSPAVGAWPNHYLSLFELTLRQPDADAYLLVQDDAVIYDGENVREYLEQALWPGGGAPVVSLYCPAPYNASRYGWHRLWRPWVWGAQAFLFSPDAARKYLRNSRVCQHRWRSAQGGLKQIDVLLGWWAWWRRVPIWYPTPSLVRHIGDVSTLWVDNRTVGKRAADLFVGPRGWVSRVADEPPLTERPDSPSPALPQQS
jgi:hypothetical protein